MKIEFMDPYVRERFTTRVVLTSVAFVEGFDEAVGFTIEISGRLFTLIVEATLAGKYVYKCLDQILRKHVEWHKGLYKTHEGVMMTMWFVKPTSLEEIVNKVNTEIGTKWKEALISIKID